MQVSKQEITHAESELIQRIVSLFEDAWQSGRPPALDDYLASSSSIRVRLLVELVSVDLDYRLRAGESVRVEHYRERYPELNECREELLELVRAEFKLRQRQESNLHEEEFLQRFPGCAEALHPSVSPDTANLAPAQESPATLSTPVTVYRAGVQLRIPPVERRLR